MCTHYTIADIKKRQFSPGPHFDFKRESLCKLVRVTAPARTHIITQHIQSRKLFTTAHNYLQDAAFQAYSNRDFQEAVNLITQIINKEKSSPRWLEMRAQVGVTVISIAAFVAMCTMLGPSQRNPTNYHNCSIVFKRIQYVWLCDSSFGRIGRFNSSERGVNN